MNIKMNGKEINMIVFEDDSIIKSNSEEKLLLSATYHGDRDEFWVVCYKNSVEIARHNCKYIVSIIWA